jgi:hypothetical protein
LLAGVAPLCFAYHFRFATRRVSLPSLVAASVYPASCIMVRYMGGWVESQFRQAPSDERVFSLQINPPEGSEFTYGTQTSGISLSPDGKTAAYIATDKGKAALWVRPLDGTTARRVGSTVQGSCEARWVNRRRAPFSTCPGTADGSW